MSFSSTPLNRGRRLDHNTFLGKPPSAGNRPPSPARLIPTSYSYGASTLGSRSPPKPSSPNRDRNNSLTEEDGQNEPALTRYHRLKEREQALQSRPGGPKIITSPPKPDKWSVKDTSVNIASAFTQAANDMLPSNPNNSWASGSSRPNPAVPRSTSVEYEREAQAASTRRIAPPPGRNGAPRAPGRRPLSKTTSSHTVPDSEGEEDAPRNERGKSPFADIMDSAKRALGPASYYLMQKLATPSDSSLEAPPANGRDTSYDYAAEEREYQQTRRGNNSTHRRNRMSTDNKAYAPPPEAELSSEDDSEDDDRTKKRAKKKGPPGGPLDTLPVVTQERRKKKRAKGSKADIGGGEGAGNESDKQTTETQSAQHRESIPRTSVPPQPPSRQSVPRGSVPPESMNDNDYSLSTEMEQGLLSIPEVDEELFDQDETSAHDAYSRQQRRSTSRPPSSSRIGAPLGVCVNFVARVIRYIISFAVQTMITLFYACGRVLGTMFHVLCVRPYEWVSKAGPGAQMLAGLFRYLIPAMVLVGAWYILQGPMLQFIPRLPAGPVYTPPDAPAANIAELSARLQRIENALAMMSLDAEKSRAKAENDIKSHSELLGRLGGLENRLTVESRRNAEMEVQSKKVTKESLNAVRQEVEILQAQVKQQHQQHQGKKEESTRDEEARAKLKSLEERVGGVEGGVKEALELSKKAGSGVSSGVAPAWWSKIGSGNDSRGKLTIQSSDGQDITLLIGHLVDAAVSIYGKDMLARPDFALHSGGARIIPSLTTATFEMRPPSTRGQLLGLVTGSGYAIGRPPITALHHELQNGHCWPFAGTEGQLGVALAAPTYISDVTIDHVARELAFDLRSAPREMEVWGMVEGKDNISKVKQWMAEKARRREEAKEQGENADVEDEVEYPKTLPKTPQYIRIANFRYNIHAANHVQTFPVSQEIQDLGVDFGIVVLRIKNNWGRDEFTCLYRMRVHGQRMGEVPLPYPEELS